MRLLSRYSFFLIFLIASCANDNAIPKDVLPQATMQRVLWDMISAGEFYNGYIANNDSLDKTAERSALYARVFTIHGINKEDFDKSYRYYREHPTLMKEILDSLAIRPATPVAPPTTETDTVYQRDDTLLIPTDSFRKKPRPVP